MTTRGTSSPITEIGAETSKAPVAWREHLRRRQVLFDLEGVAVGYAVKVNTKSREIVIHREGCGHVERRGGAPGKYGQVHWDHFDSLKEAEAHAQRWKKGRAFPLKYCYFCFPEKRGQPRR